MKRAWHKAITKLLAIGLLLLLTGQPLSAETLYEFYTTASTKDLNAQTRDMGRNLKTAFNQRGVSARMQQIDFSEYYSNLKKTLFYAQKLATYNDYEGDLRFARDNEVFKGLPDVPDDGDGSKRQDERKTFVQKKYVRMTQNVEEEIETYEDLVQISLDACESLAENDLSNIFNERENKSRMLTMTKEDVYLGYQNRHEQLKSSWPQLSARIDAQLARWLPRPAAPGDPIIDPNITGAI